jgi:hypothetical protein
VLVAYRIAEKTLNVSARALFGEDDDPFCIVVFLGATFHQFAPPNDEDLHAHPLASHVLLGYRAHEIMNSSLVADS